MKRLIFPLLMICLKLPVLGQLQQPVRIDTTRESIEYWTKWTNNMYEMGADFRNDSFIVKEETMRLLKDPVYRAATYPDVYTWKAAVALMDNMELKKAFWHVMNLYQTDTAHRRMAVGTFVAYDSVMDMSKVLVSTFYTYAFADPRVCRITNNHPDIYRPDIIEKGQVALKELVSYILYYRKQKAALKKN